MKSHKMKKTTKYYLKKLVTYILILSLIFISVLNIRVSTEAAEPGWKNAYNKILNNWKLIEKYAPGTASYLEFYFRSDYKFNRYFLCDIDKNGVPELFLHSTTMKQTAIFTYENEKVVFLDCNEYYKINTTEHKLVVHGHWHGAGGSNKYEWWAFKMKNNKINCLYYIDKINKKYQTYTVKNGKWKFKLSKTLYKKIYINHINKGKKFSNYKKFKLTNKSELQRY